MFHSIAGFISRNELAYDSFDTIFLLADTNTISSLQFPIASSERWLRISRAENEIDDNDNKMYGVSGGRGHWLTNDRIIEWAHFSSTKLTHKRYYLTITAFEHSAKRQFVNLNQIFHESHLPYDNITVNKLTYLFERASTSTFLETELCSWKAKVSLDAILLTSI